jgi:hypothetical protein
MSTTFLRPQKAARDEEELALYFIVRAERDEDDERLFAVAKDLQQTLSDRISGMVPAVLGSLFRMRKVEIRRGSVEFWVFVAGGFTLISQYADFVRSLELLLSQIQNLLYNFFLNQGVPVLVTGGWTQASAKRPSRLASFRISPELITLLLVSYLIASHAVLLMVLVRIALKALLPAK